ncbi:MAG: hypothetical protein KF902_08905 [Phycisphaeraceae bacterium]|nr:hypothetical protein [Phycisphaeraceae bacterium]MCW5767230.1 hypothetical protein [Phycisphaeraceae bacterium]
MTAAPNQGQASSVAIPRELIHELNNRLFVIRLGAATLLEAAQPVTSSACIERLKAIATAAEEADAIVKRLQTTLRPADNTPTPQV